MAATWSWIARTRQREIIEMYNKHIDKIIETVEHSLKMIEHYKIGKIEEAKKEYEIVFEKEKEADDIKRQIIAELSKELFHPIDREELLRMILTTDDIAAYVKAMSRRLLLIISEEIDEDIVEDLIRMDARILDATRLIKEAARKLIEDPRKALELADNIERLEEEVDEIRMEALEKVMRFCDKTKNSLCIISKDLVDSLENASDRCEDTADVIRSIALLR